MHSKILQKCLDELNKDAAADLSYIKGMIETLLALGESEIRTLKQVAIPPIAPQSVTPSIVESAMTDAERVIANLRAGSNSHMTITDQETVEHNTIQ